MIGRRTARDLTRSLIPTRVYVILAVIAVFVAVGMWILARLSRGVVPDWMADEFYRYAQTFRAMPPWFLIGGSLTQFAGRLNIAVDDALVWIKDWFARAKQSERQDWPRDFEMPTRFPPND